MKKFYRKKCFYWIGMVLAGAVGCHQEPVVPESAIPTRCRIYQILGIDEATRDTTTYAYNDFGSTIKSSYRQWIGSQLVSRIEQEFVFTADHYLSSQIDRITTRSANGSLTQLNKGYTYTYQDGRIQQVAIINNTTGAKIGSLEYTYAGDQPKTYVEKDGNGTLVKSYTFDEAGKLSDYKEPNAVTSFTLGSNKKIAQRILSNGTVASYTYDTDGQLTRRTVVSGNMRSEYTYSYDSKPYWTKTQLRLRGMPLVDLGDGVQVYNLSTTTYERFQDDKSLGKQVLTYTPQIPPNPPVDPAKNNFQGYLRSDGVRLAYYYTNCL